MRVKERGKYKNKTTGMVVQLGEPMYLDADELVFPVTTTKSIRFYRSEKTIENSYKQLNILERLVLWVKHLRKKPSGWR